jgi:hypothetical protein
MNHWITRMTLLSLIVSVSIGALGHVLIDACKGNEGAVKWATFLLVFMVNFVIFRRLRHPQPN